MGVEMSAEAAACVPFVGAASNVGLFINDSVGWSRGEATLADVAIDFVGIAYDPADWARYGAKSIQAAGSSLVVSDFIAFTATQGFKLQTPALYADPDAKNRLIHR